MKKVKVLLLIGCVFFMVNSVNAHFTVCVSRSGFDIGLCGAKEGTGHGDVCRVGNCLTDPAWYQFLTKKCNCMGQVDVDYIEGPI